jgi:hypothetical protein
MIINDRLSINVSSQIFKERLDRWRIFSYLRLALDWRHLRASTNYVLTCLIPNQTISEIPLANRNWFWAYFRPLSPRSTCETLAIAIFLLILTQDFCAFVESQKLSFFKNPPTTTHMQSNCAIINEAQILHNLLK